MVSVVLAASSVASSNPRIVTTDIETDRRTGAGTRSIAYAASFSLASLFAFFGIALDRDFAEISCIHLMKS
jgi:hypothetical protein